MRRTALISFGLGSLLLVSPQASLEQTTVDLAGPLSPDPARIAVRSGGNVAISALKLEDAGNCNFGYINDPAGRVEIEITHPQSIFGLYIYAESDRDVMLIVETAFGSIMCDDDSHTDLNPMIHVPIATPGPYTIYVGTYTSSPVDDATLFLSHTDPTSGSSVAGGSSPGIPDISLEPGSGRVSLSAPFSPDPHTVAIAAGGSVDVDVPGCTYGYVARAPNYNLTYSGSGSTLYFFARADEDTTLLINKPDATWICDDDSLGDSNPVVTIPNAPSGLYNIWVGTYGTSITSSTLYISTKGAK